MILFLDFDGVLHPETSDAELFCRLPLFWELLRQCPEVEVVFSTSWREIYPQDELLAFVTSGGGEDLAHRFIGSTPLARKPPYEDDYRLREIECLAWLEGSGLQERPWLALDDVAYWFSPNNSNHYLVNYRTGLTEVDMAEIVRRSNT